jgi:hypothetical protein
MASSSALPSACFICSSRFASDAQLEVHVNIHLDEDDAERSAVLAAELAVGTVGEMPSHHLLGQNLPLRGTVICLDDDGDDDYSESRATRSAAGESPAPVRAYSTLPGITTTSHVCLRCCFG